MRMAAKIALGALAVIVLLGVAVVATLQSAGGQRFLGAEVSKLISTPAAPVSIGAIGYAWPNRLTVNDLRVGDAAGEWLRVDRVTALLALRRIVTGRIALQALDIGEVAVARLPSAGESGGGSSGSLPSVAIDRLTIASLRLAQPVLGENVVFRIDGRLELGTRDTVALMLQRTDGVAGRLALDVELDAGQGRLVAAGELDEPTGVLLERFTGRRAPLAVHLSGQGALADFHGALKVESSAQALLAAAFTVAQQEKAYAIGLEGQLNGADLVPAQYADLLKDGLRFSAHGLGGGGSRIVLDRLQATADAVTLDGHGTYDTGTQAVDGEIAASLPDLAKFSAPLNTSLGGSADIRILASGTTASPAARLSLTVDDAIYRDDRVRHLEATVDLALDGDRIDASGSGRVAGIAVGTTNIPAGFGEAADFRLGGRFARDLSDIRLDGAEVAENGASLSLAGTFVKGAADGTARLTIDDLARLAAAAGQTMTGSATVDAVLASTPDGATSARLTGRAEQLMTGQAPLDALTGGRVDLAAAARRAADGTVTLDSFELSAADARVTAEGALPPSFDRITAKLGVELSDLGKLAAAVGSSAAGHLSASADVLGPLTSPQIKASVDGGDLAANGKPLGQLHVDLDTPDLSSTAGKLAARLAGPDLVATVSSGVAWRDATLALTKLQIAAAGARIAGDLDVAPAGPAARGALTATIPDLGAFSRFAGTPLAGRIDGRVALAAKGGQNVDLTLNGQNLALGAPGANRLALARLTATGKLTDVLGAPKGQAELRLNGIVAGGGAVDQANMRLVSSTAGRFRVTGDAAGRYIEPVTISLAGDATLGGAVTSVSLAKLAGKFGDDAFALTRPLRIEHSTTATSFSNLALTIGPGRIAGNGKLDSRSLAVILRGEQLPVELGARLAGYHEVAGRLGIDLDLQGPLAAPRGRLVLTGDALRLAAASRPDLPPLTLSARGDWQGGRMDFRGRIDAPRNAAIGFSGSAPFELRQGLAIAVPPTGRLGLKLEGDGELAQFNDLLPMSEDHISGHYALNARVDGTVAAPQAGGSLIVSGGRFEDVTSGLTLTGIDFELDGNQQRFVMSRFAAGDGEKGRITAKGGVDLVATPGPAIDLRIALEHLRAVRRDDADVTAEGTVNLGGTLTAPQVGADITVENAELSIPDNLTANAPNLQVVRINSKTGQTVPAQSKPGQEAPPLLSAKLAIKVKAPGQIFVRGHGLDAEWRADLSVTGTSAAPIITGSLEVVRGTFSLLGKDFNLTRGTISFAGGTSADPVLDLVAEATSTGITVQATITGTVSSPTIRLTSTPVMPQDEVLSRLLFGTSVGQITPIQGLQLAQAAAQLAGGGGTDILGTIRRNLGLDRLSIGSSDGTSGALPGGPLSTASSSSNSQSGVSNTTISAGKYIIPGFYVGVAQGIGSAQSAVRVEGEVTPNVTIDVQAGGQARESIGLNFKLDY
ncbi:MAG: uncharacterized protein JWL84_2748 [Rhodospirillales bacterium]|nr:uncharacterized protein [Rhodospirillales bacterium]